MREVSFEKICDVDAEKSLLGNLIMNPDNVYSIKDSVQPDDFYRQEHRIVYETILSLSKRKMLVDLKSVANELNRENQIERVGGTQLLTDIVYHASKTDNTQYIRQIRMMSNRRKLVSLGRQMIDAAGDMTQNVNPDEWQSKISELTLEDKVEVVPFKKSLLDFLSEIDRRRTLGSVGVMSGFPRLDVTLKGWQPTELIVIAARPSVGKTAFALNCAANAVKEGKKVAFFSMEMSRYELISRVMACENNIPLGHFVDGKDITDAEYNKVFKWCNDMEKSGFFIFDSIGGKPSEIMTLSKMVHGKYGLDLIIVDYLQLLRADRTNNNHAVEVGDISWSLKQMAKRLNVPVIALSQLNRAVESRQDTVPKLSDLRDSGNIEQDANVVLALSRSGANAGDEPVKDITLSVLKNRNGPLNTIQLQFYGAFMRFVNAPMDAKPVSNSSIPM